MENASVPFMEHPFHQIRIKKLSDNVRSRIRNGHTVRVQPTEGEGINLLVHSHRINNMNKSMRQGKGTQLALHPAEIEANKSIEGEGIFGKKKEGIFGKKKLAYVEGEGVFGKKADKFLEKHGVKKIAYAVGSAVKPFAQQAITSLGTMADAYAPGLGTLAAHTANDYLDRPEAYQKMVRDEMKGTHGVPAGNYKAKAIDMLADKLKNGGMGGDTVGHLDRASMSKAMADRASKELADRIGKARASSAGMGLYAGRGLGVGLYGAGAMPRRREYHSIGGRHLLMGQGVPALVSQPFGVNYNFRTQMPPAYQQLHA